MIEIKNKTALDDGKTLFEVSATTEDDNKALHSFLKSNREHFQVLKVTSNE